MDAWKIKGHNKFVRVLCPVVVNRTPTHSNCMARVDHDGQRVIVHSSTSSLYMNMRPTISLRINVVGSITVRVSIMARKRVVVHVNYKELCFSSICHNLQLSIFDVVRNYIKWEYNKTVKTCVCSTCLWLPRGVHIPLYGFPKPVLTEKFSPVSLIVLVIVLLVVLILIVSLRQVLPIIKSS